MMRTFHLRSAIWLVMVPAGGMAQRYVPPPPPLTVDPCAAHAPAAIPVDPKTKAPVCPPPAPQGAAPDTTVPGKDSTAEKFPFPGSAPPSVPPAASPAKGSSAADKFPYPGETSASPDAVPEGNTPRYVPDAPPPGESSSSSSSSSNPDSSSTGTDDGGTGSADTPAEPPKRGRRQLPKVSAVSPDERVSEDLSVARFYSDRGNFQAAYLRSKDATKVMPDDPEGHFALAQASEKLHKNDEAAAEYALYLKLDPSGEKRAAAQRALLALR